MVWGCSYETWTPHVIERRGTKHLYATIRISVFFMSEWQHYGEKVVVLIVSVVAELRLLPQVYL